MGGGGGQNYFHSSPPSSPPFPDSPQHSPRHFQACSRLGVIPSLAFNRTLEKDESDVSSQTSATTRYMGVCTQQDTKEYLNQRGT